MDFKIGEHVSRTEKATEKWFDLSEDLNQHGFEVLLAHISRKTLDRWVRDCTRSVRNPVTKRKEPKLDEKALWRLYASHVIRDWRGLTVGMLRKMIVLTGCDEVAAETVVACNQENVVSLLENAFDFDTVVTDIARDPANFLEGGPRETEEEETEVVAEEEARGN